MPTLIGFFTQALRQPSTRRLSGLMILLLVAAQAPLHADWLVLTSGERIETRGAWELKSNAVLFTSMRGQFSSVQAGDVDVEASRKLTEESQKAAEAETEEPAPIEPVLVLVDGDVPLYRPPQSAEQGGEDAPNTRAAPSSEATENRTAQQTIESAKVEVIDWRSPPQTPDGIIVEGRIQNRGDLIAAGITLRVTLRDAEGVEIGVSTAELSAAALTPGARSLFRATFQGVLSFSTVEFSVAGTEVDSANAEGPIE